MLTSQVFLEASASGSSLARKSEFKSTVCMSNLGLIRPIPTEMAYSMAMLLTSVNMMGSPCRSRQLYPLARICFGSNSDFSRQQGQSYQVRTVLERYKGRKHSKTVLKIH